MVRVGTNLWMPSGLILLWVYLDHAVLDCVQSAFEDLQGGKLHNLSGKPVSVFHHPHSIEVLLDVQKEPPVFQFVPIASCPGTEHH